MLHQLKSAFKTLHVTLLSHACPCSKSSPPAVLCPDRYILWFPSSSSLTLNTLFLSYSHSLNYSSYLSSKIPKSVSWSRSLLWVLVDTFPVAFRSLFLEIHNLLKTNSLSNPLTPKYSHKLAHLHIFPQTQSVGRYLGNTTNGSLFKALDPLTKPLLILSSSAP